MKEPHSNDHISPGVLMTPAQKAAGEISGWRYLTAHGYVVTKTKTHSHSEPLYSQQAITEAVDAAVAQERERYKGLARKWRIESMQAGQAMNALCGGKGYSELAATKAECASELESLVKQP